MEIRSYPYGPLQANMHVVIIGKDAFVIDPCVPYDSTDLSEYHLRGIFCTHAHFDHIIEADNMFHSTGSVIMAMESEIKALTKPGKVGTSDSLLPSYSVKSPVCALKEGDVFTAFDFDMKDTEIFTIRVIHTPGHTSGSMCLLFEVIDQKKPNKFLFSGDTVFAGTIGRTDLGGNLNDMRNSVSKIAMLSKDVVIYPGHGDMTTVGREKLENPYFTAPFYNDII